MNYRAYVPQPDWETIDPLTLAPWMSVPVGTETDRRAVTVTLPAAVWDQVQRMIGSSDASGVHTMTGYGRRAIISAMLAPKPSPAPLYHSAAEYRGFTDGTEHSS